MFCIDQDVLAGGFADRGQGGYGFDRSDYMAGDRDRSEAHSVLFKSACCCFALPPSHSPSPKSILCTLLFHFVPHSMRLHLTGVQI